MTMTLASAQALIDAANSAHAAVENALLALVAAQPAPAPPAPPPPAPVPAPTPPPPAPVPTPAPTTWTGIAGEGSAFTLSAPGVVRYGNGTTWSAAKPLPAGTYVCNNATFGDPLPGNYKVCQLGSAPATAPSPSPAPAGIATYVGGKQPGFVAGPRGVGIAVVVDLGGPLNAASVDVQMLSAGLPAAGAGNFASKVTAPTYSYAPATGDGGGKQLSAVLTPRDANGVAGPTVTIPGVSIP